MTHVLDPLIGYLDQKPTEGCACKICEGCREALRILRAEREGRREGAEGDWWCPECEEALPPSRVTYQERCDTCGSAVSWKEAREPTPDEMRAEGRREERERVDAILLRRVNEAERWIGAVAAAIEDARKEIRGDHWRGGEG